MKREDAARFSSEVERFRRSLLHAARMNDWQGFQDRAGRLFDYVENVEAAERERRFWQVFLVILSVLVLFLFLLLGIEPPSHPEWPQYRNSLVLAALGASSFELYFYVNFRTYASQRALHGRRRRAVFIRHMENDFRALVRQNAAPGR